tara:strand:+ start:1103 stop:1339 length:237 start_codon:yes stop_codon:yes gene_type:complete
MTSRARSVAHVEYEILEWVGRRAWLDGLMAEMVPEGDKVAEKRFRTGATNISTYLSNMMVRRQHKLPKDHTKYMEREE